MKTNLAPAITAALRTHYVDLLKRFILHFKDKGSEIIKKSIKDRIILPNHFELHDYSKNSELHVTDEIKNEFLRETSLKKLD